MDYQTTAEHPFSIAFVCSSNMNRSMAAQYLFNIKYGYHTWSYGTGSSCKLPGSAPDKPVVKQFYTPYKDIAEDLKKQNLCLYDYYFIYNASLYVNHFFKQRITLLLLLLLLNYCYIKMFIFSINLFFIFFLMK